jgi:hypothetical protein
MTPLFRARFDRRLASIRFYADTTLSPSKTQTKEQYRRFADRDMFARFHVFITPVASAEARHREIIAAAHSRATVPQQHPA